MNCVYCLVERATTRDHLVPYFYAGRVPTRKRRGGGDPGETVPACRRCNSILGNKLFRSFQSRRAYVLKRLRLPTPVKSSPPMRYKALPAPEVQPKAPSPGFPISLQWIKNPTGLIAAFFAIALGSSAAFAQSVWGDGAYPVPSDRSTLTQPLFTQPYADPEPPPSAYHAPPAWIGSHTPAMDIWNNGRDTVICTKTPYTTICQ